MKVICYAGALEEGWSAGETRPRGRTQKDKGRRMKLSGPERRARRNRKKGRNAQGKSVISFCACGYDISNRLPPLPPRRPPLFSPPRAAIPWPVLTPCLLYTAPPEKVARLSSSAKDKAGWVVSRGDGGWMGAREAGGMQIKILAIFPFLIFHGGSQLQRPPHHPIIESTNAMRNYTRRTLEHV